MKIIAWKNGVKTERDMTPEEIAALEAQVIEQPEPTPTIEERVESLENTSDDVILMIAELIGGEQ